MREGEKGGEKGLASLRVPAPGWRPYTAQQGGASEY